MASDLIVWKEEGDEHAAYAGSRKIGAVYQTEMQEDWYGYANGHGRIGSYLSLDAAKTRVETIWHNRKVK